MKKFKLLLFFIILTFLYGCGDQLNLEKTTITLMLGIDEGEEERFEVFQTSPVFSREAPVKIQTFSVQASSLREARKKFDSKTSGNVVGGKLQVILISKKVLKKYNIYKYFDVFYRDPKYSVTAYITAYDGDLSELVNFLPADKPRIAVHIKRLISTTRQNESTATTTLQIFRRLNEDKALTPFMAEIKRDGSDDIVVTGIALLNKDGKYMLTIDKHQSALMLILRDDLRFPVPLTFDIDNEQENSGEVSFDVMDLDRRIKSNYANGKFSFNIFFKMDVNLTESYLTVNTYKEKRKVEKMIEKQVKKEMEELIKTFQEHEVCPIGLGMHARAYHYQEFKKIEDNWPEAFKNADINLDIKVQIQNTGILKY